MKKLMGLLIAIVFPTLCCGQTFVFSADEVIEAMNHFVPNELYSQTAAEYEAQMDPDTGAIDEDGLYNVCYVAGFDVSTVDGAAKCAGFINAAITQRNCADVVGCVYGHAPSASSEAESRARMCIFNETMKYVLDWEKGLNESSGLKGNEYGNVTNYGITSQYSKLSVDCVRCMTWRQAQNWYWANMYQKFHLDEMPVYVSAPLMQFSVQHNGVVLKETKEIMFGDARVKKSEEVQNACSVSQLNPANYTNTFFKGCSQTAGKKYVELNGGQAFFDAIVDKEIVYWSNKNLSKYVRRAKGVREKLWPATEQCMIQNNLM
jgi:hypothetical protein